MVLYPLLIEGTIPPFTFNNTTNKINLSIPYQLNRGGYIPENGIARIIIKTIPLGNQLLAINTSINDIDKNNKIINCEFESSLLYSGEYYKIQVAICTWDIESEEIIETGYFSTPSIVKFTNEPVLNLLELKGKNITATFSSLDPTEYLYSSQFIVYDHLNNEIEKSNEIIYNSYNNDSNDKSLQNYEIKSILRPGYEYFIVWKIRTNNGLEREIRRSLYSKEILEPDYNLIPYTVLNYDNGLIDIGIKNYNKNGIIEDLNGNYILGDYQLFRASSVDNFNNWQFITEFKNLTTSSLSYGNNLRVLIRDYNIKHGECYKYKLSQINRNEIANSNPKEYMNLNSIGFNSETITADFDSMFLCDENKQLKIAFNPKMSTFKNIIMESKLDMIGSKYPYFFRNDDIYYKEFNLSGLISYLEDPDNLFDFNNYSNIQTTNLTSSNIHKERLFKEEVLNWLNNGQTKLLKTPTEGNYFVRLMNVSLSPNDTLGRMLHTFTATGYEVEDNLNLLFKNYYNEFITDNNLRVYTETNPMGEVDIFGKNIRKMIFSNIPKDTLQVTIGGYYKNAPGLYKSQTYTIGQTGYHYTTPTNFIITYLYIDLTDLTELQLDIYEEIALEEGVNQNFKNFTGNIDINSKNNGILIATVESNQLTQNTKIYNKFQYYKLAQFIQVEHIQPTLSLNEINQVQLIDSTGQLKTYNVLDQLLFEDCYLNIQNLGSNLRLEYAIADYVIT